MIFYNLVHREKRSAEVGTGAEPSKAARTSLGGIAPAADFNASSPDPLMMIVSWNANHPEGRVQDVRFRTFDSVHTYAPFRVADDHSRNRREQW
jgi:hypothetical protein